MSWSHKLANSFSIRDAASCSRCFAKLGITRAHGHGPADFARLHEVVMSLVTLSGPADYPTRPLYFFVPLSWPIATHFGGEFSGQDSKAQVKVNSRNARTHNQSNSSDPKCCGKLSPPVCCCVDDQRNNTNIGSTQGIPAAVYITPVGENTMSSLLQRNVNKFLRFCGREHCGYIGSTSLTAPSISAFSC